MTSKFSLATGFRLQLSLKHSEGGSWERDYKHTCEQSAFWASQGFSSHEALCLTDSPAASGSPTTKTTHHAWDYPPCTYNISGTSGYRGIGTNVLVHSSPCTSARWPRPTHWWPRDGAPREIWMRNADDLRSKRAKRFWCEADFL